MSLHEQKCVPCRGGVPTLSDSEIEELRAGVPGWHVTVVEGSKALRRVFKFRDFAQALAFTDKVGTLAEGQGYHPALVTEWGRVTVMWWTHAIGGLHKNDFIMAAKTDRLA
jgi:4a-hydroxytetrahydrobiopterin dehydratase